MRALVSIGAMVCGTVLLLATPLHATVIAANAIVAGPDSPTRGREWSVGSRSLREAQWAPTMVGAVLVLGGLALGAWAATSPTTKPSAR